MLKLQLRVVAMNNIRVLISLVMFTFMSSCTMAPKMEIHNPKYSIPQNYKNMNSSSPVSSDSISQSEWWHSFNDKNLNILIDSVIQSNLDLQLAVSRVELVETKFKISRARRLPTVNASAGYSFTNVPPMVVQFPNDPQSPILNGNKIEIDQGGNKFTLRTGLRFELDVWGKLRAMEKSAIADYKASKEELNTAYLGIIAQAIILYYDIESRKRQNILSEKNLVILGTNLDTQKKRYALGIGNKINLELTTQAYEGAKIKLESSRQMLRLKLHKLSVLVNEYPESIVNNINLNKNLAPKMSTIPMAIPSQLLRTRSDIRSAEFKIESAREGIGVARADFFPNISLTAGIGLAAGELSKLFSKDVLSENIGVDVNQPVFSGGSKITALKQRKIIYRQQVLSYQKTVLNAFKEVEDALVTIDAVGKQLTATRNLVAASVRARNEMERRYLKGIFPYDKFLEAEKSLFAAKSQLITIENLNIMARVQLHRALGGAWIDIDA